MPLPHAIYLKFRSSVGFIAVLTLWFFVVNAVFFSHFPFLLHFSPGFLNANNLQNTDLFERIMSFQSSFLNVASGFVVVGILWSSGKRLRHWLTILGSTNSINFCLDFGLGIFVLNTFWMGLGLVRLWAESLWLIGIVFLAIQLTKDILTIRQSWSLRMEFPWTLLMLGISYFGFLLLHSLLPETFYDSLNYFLAMPSFWLFQHGISDCPTHLLSGYFHGGSLFFLNGFILGGTEGAKALNVVILFCLGVGVFGWVKELGGFLAGTFAGMAIFTFPLLFLNTLAVRVDGLLCFSLFLFFYSFDKACQASSKKEAWIIVASLFAGLALSIKPTAVVGIGAAFLAYFWEYGFQPVKRFKKIWLFLLALPVLEVGPWLVKNACFAGNPFFPYAISWMGGRQFPAWSYQRLLHENQQFLPMDQGLMSFIDLPWRLTMPQSGDGQFIGPLLLAFLPVLFFTRTQNKSIGFLVKTMLLSFVFGLSLSHMLRFSMPAFVLAFMILTLALTAEKNDWLKILWGGALVFSGLLFFVYYLGLSARFFNGMGIWTGRETAEGYLNRQMLNSYEPIVVWTDQNLPADARLLIVGDARGLYYRRTFYANSVFDEPFFAAAARGEKDAEGIWTRLHQMGITHVVFNIPEGERVSSEYHHYDLSLPEWKKLNDFVRSGLEPLYWKDFLAVYKVKNTLNPASNNIVNPFSFFSEPAHAFIESFQTGRFFKAEQALNEELVLFPGENYWVEKMNLLKESGKNRAKGTGSS